MIESKIRNISGKVSRSSIFLSRSLLDSNRIERNLEKKSLVLKSKLVEQRGRTLAGIASRSRETQKGGILGGALGLLISGGSLLRRKPKTPKSPSQLLRMQRGTSNLSRAGRLGRLARPLAVVGTGLDFAGRRAEGQTNLQAGVGAGGGLAGAIGGAKIGAAIGTAILPGAGTAIGGLGGSIIGGLVGGNLADILTGANRRRQFEVQRTVLRTQKTLFSRALDDFDDVLDNFEKIPIGLDKKRRNEEIEARRRGRPRFRLPKIRLKNFFQRPTVRNIGVTALAIGTTVLAVKAAPALIALGAKAKILFPAFKKALATKGFSKLPLEKQLRVIAKEIGREKLIKRMSKAFDKNRGKIMKTKKEAKIRRLKKIEKEKADINKKLEKLEDPDAIRDLVDVDDNVKLLRKALREGVKDETFDATRFRKAIEEFSNVMADMLEDGGITKIEIDDIISELKRYEEGFDLLIDNQDKLYDFERFIRKMDKIIGPDPNKLSEVPEDQRIDPAFASPPEPPESLDSTNLALAPMGNIFLLGGNTNNQQQQQSPPIINDQNNIGMTPVTFSPYTAVAQQIIFESSLTA